MMTEVQCGPTPTEWNEWIGYEAMLTHAIANLPVRVVCSFDAHETPDPVLDGVWRTHPEVLRDDWSPSPSFEPPEETLGRLAPEPERLDGLQTIAATGDLENLREVLARELRAANVPPAKALDMLVAATEVASNSRVHGGGIEEVRVGLGEGRFVCEIGDGGGGFDHLLAGYRLPSMATPPVSGSPGSGPGAWSSCARRMGLRRGSGSR